MSDTQILIFYAIRGRDVGHLILGESVLVVEDVDSFIHGTKINIGSGVSSDLQTEFLARGVHIAGARALHFQLKTRK